MTIAACYVCSDGIVFGTDSTWTVPVECADGIVFRYFNHRQKILQVGDGSTLGIIIWGLVVLKDLSFRTIIARFADSLQDVEPKSMEEVAVRCRDVIWSEFSKVYREERTAYEALLNLDRNEEEELGLEALKETIHGGVCLGGYVLSDRLPKAFEISCEVGMDKAADPIPILFGSLKTWGLPNLMNRILVGVDAKLLKAIEASGRWQGTHEDLVKIVTESSSLAQPTNLPIREAVDWVDAVLNTTVKVTKFTHLPQICGGPIDLAVITTDRPFRWVRRKQFSSAIHQQSTEF